MTEKYMGHAVGSIPRLEMPQIKSLLVGEFLAGKVAVARVVEANSLRPTQGEMVEDSILAIMGKEEQLAKPCLVAGGWVLDGHHRWAACQRLGREVRIIDLVGFGPVEALVEMAKFAALHPTLCAAKSA